MMGIRREIPGLKSTTANKADDFGGLKFDILDELTRTSGLKH